MLQGPYVRPDGSLGVETHRADRDAESAIRSAFPRLSLGKDLTPTDPEQFRVYRLSDAPEGDALGEVLADLLAKRLPWLDDT